MAMASSSPAIRSGKRKGRSSKSTSPPTYTPKTPESSSGFERELLRSPNSSYLWIRYMSFQLQLSWIDEAREIAKLALSTINIREEAEKLNIWNALMILGNVYGTEESLESVFKDAIANQKPFILDSLLFSGVREARECRRTVQGRAQNSGNAPKSGRCSANTTRRGAT
ncbi:hypothetical protein BJY52DRAFT_173629 [Lactarius psammicola]|nr:hypothetical protein BJY52DRAFT_173629 [Lactarius psammicola]